MDRVVDRADDRLLGGRFQRVADQQGEKERGQENRRTKGSELFNPRDLPPFCLPGSWLCADRHTTGSDAGGREELMFAMPVAIAAATETVATFTRTWADWRNPHVLADVATETENKR